MTTAKRKTALAVASHPDDIEFMMAGTLLRLQDLGYEIHYQTVANGSLGTDKYDRDTIVAMRRAEAMESAALVGAVYHESLCDDLEVFYNYELLARVVEVMREVEPEIVLTHGPYDYMEDHVNAGRLAVSAAFCRGMTNFKCRPGFKATGQNVAVYHSLPLSLKDQLNKPVIPDIFVDIGDKIQIKRAMLNCHRSQKEWLDATQGLDAYLDDMQHRCEAVGRLSGFCALAEGWIRHNPIGFCPEEFDPLSVIARPAR